MILSYVLVAAVMTALTACAAGRLARVHEHRAGWPGHPAARLGASVALGLLWPLLIVALMLVAWATHAAPAAAMSAAPDAYR